MYLSELTDRYTYHEYPGDTVRGIGIFCNSVVKKLASSTKELAIDATYGTNNIGMDLFAVLAEVDGAGVVLAYLLLGKRPGVVGEDGRTTDKKGGSPCERLAA